MALNKEQILAVAKRPPVKKLTVPELGEGEAGQVYIRVMTGAEYESYDQSLGTEGQPTYMANFREKFLCRCLCDHNGARLFSDEDWKQIAELPVSVLSVLHKEADALHKRGKADGDALVKNS
jgi:hypothetical protein